jgi:hypothetical protein
MNTENLSSNSSSEYRHSPEVMNNEKFGRLNQDDTTSQLLDLFNSVAFQKGQHDLCRDIYHPRKEMISNELGMSLGEHPTFYLA